MYRSAWLNFVSQKVPVTIRYSDGGELDRNMWAVTVDSDPEFWLDAFDDCAEAVRFCRKYGLPYKIDQTRAEAKQ